MTKSHEDLVAWQRAIDLVDLVYDLCQLFPTEERFGLASQMQRAAVSVPANIAEGCGRQTTKDLLRHLSIARGSLAELRTLLLIAGRREFVKTSELSSADAAACSVGRLLTGLQRSLRRKLPPPK